MKEIEELGDHFTGLWGFRRHGKEIKFCASIVYKDRHWDTNEYKTPERALKEAVKLLKKLK